MNKVYNGIQFFYIDLLCITNMDIAILTVCVCMDARWDMDVTLTTYEGPRKWFTDLGTK